MIFNKNQKEFPSEIQKDIWHPGIQILPLHITLPVVVRNSLPYYMVNSCEQMQKCFLHLLSDMYDNINIYEPLPCGKNGYPISVKVIRPFVDFALIGEATEDSLIINRYIFDKFVKKLCNSKPYSDDKKQDISLEQRLKLLERCGFYIEYNGENVVFSNKLYPNMFYALCQMAKITLNEKSSGSNSFTYCDFRKLCKNYKYDKYENVFVFLNDEQIDIVKKIEEIARSLKMTRSIKSGHCEGYTLIFNYKKVRVMHIGCLENNASLRIEIPYDKNNLDATNRFFKSIEDDSEKLKKYFYKRIKRCRMCNPKCGGFNMRIYDKPNRLCFHWVSMLFLSFGILTLDDIPFVDKLLRYTLKYIDEK